MEMNLTEMAIACFANRVRSMAEDQNISVEIMYGTCLTILNNIHEALSDEDRIAYMDSLRGFVDRLQIPAVLK